MNIDMSALILDLDDKPMDLRSLDPRAKEGDLTLGAVCTTALTAQVSGDEDMSGDAKLEIFALTYAIHGKKTVDLKVEQVVLIKTRVGKVFTPLIVGRAFPLLDPPAKVARGARPG